MIFDTHTHYDDAAFDADRYSVIESLPEEGIGRICNIGSTMQGARASAAFSEKYAHVYAAAGVHPDEVYDFCPGMRPDEAEAMFSEYESSDAGRAESEFSAEITEIWPYGRAVFEELKGLSERERTVAVGEIGLDYHGYDVYDVKPGKEFQKYWFRKQLGLAIETGKPVVIHSRNASADTMELMKRAHESGLCGAVIHCFSYSRETALEYLDMGFYLGFGGVITYEGQKKLTKALEATPLDRILIETDCPYLTPVPVRKKGVWSRNASHYLPHVIKRIAEIKNVSAEEIEKITWDNACRFYRINDGI